MDWGYVEDQANILVIVDKSSGLIEAFPAGNRTSETVKVYLSQIFARFGIPKILVSNNGPEFVNGELKQLCESLGIKKMESLVHHPRANGLAERAVQTVKRALQACSPNLKVSLEHSCQGHWWHIATHFKDEERKQRTQSETTSNSRFRLVQISKRLTRFGCGADVKETVAPDV